MAQKGFLSPQDVFERLKQRDIDVSLSDVVEIFFKLVSGCWDAFRCGASDELLLEVLMGAYFADAV